MFESAKAERDAMKAKAALERDNKNRALTALRDSLTALKEYMGLPVEEGLEAIAQGLVSKRHDR